MSGGLHGGINTYAYGLNQPTRHIDINGQRVLIEGHIAAAPFGRITNPNSYHLALYLEPDDKCQCPGIWPMTLGGQIGSGRLLVTAINYPGDAISEATFLQELKPPPGVSDCDFIKALIAAALAYRNNLPYGLPWITPVPFAPDGAMQGRYNSNSYAAGLIEAAGGTVPPLNSGGSFQAPGWYNPIPIPR